MRTADVFVHGKLAGRLSEDEPGGPYTLSYAPEYDGPPVSLTMPVRTEPYSFKHFPPFFDGLLPEGWQLDALLKRQKLDRKDFMGQLLAVGEDMVGAVTVAPESSSPEAREASP